MIIGCHISELLTLFSLSLWIVIIYLTASASSFVHNTINFVPVHAAKNMKYNFEFSFNKEWIEIGQKGDSKILGINIKRIIYTYRYIFTYTMNSMILRNSELRATKYLWYHILKIELSYASNKNRIFYKIFSQVYSQRWQNETTVIARLFVYLFSLCIFLWNCRGFYLIFRIKLNISKSTYPSIML